MEIELSPEMFQGIKRVAFDLNSTLYRSPEMDQEIQMNVVRNFIQLAQDSGHNLRYANVSGIFRSYYNEFGSASMALTQMWQGMDRTAARDIVRRSIDCIEIGKYITPNPRLVGMVTELKARDYRIDLITGTPRGKALEKLSVIGFDPSLFSLIMTSEDGSKNPGNGDVDIYDSYIQQIDVDPGEVLYLGNSFGSDYLNARQKGLLSIWVEECPQLPDESELLHSDDLIEVLELLP